MMISTILKTLEEKKRRQLSLTVQGSKGQGKAIGFVDGRTYNMYITMKGISFKQFSLQSCVIYFLSIDKKNYTVYLM